MPIFYFGLFSQFSGSQIYDVYLYNGFNIFFTGQPILWYAIYDWQYNKEELLLNPLLYDIGLRDLNFNQITFWTMYIYAILHGGLMLVLSFYTLDESAGEWLVGTNQDSKIY